GFLRCDGVSGGGGDGRCRGGVRCGAGSKDGPAGVFFELGLLPGGVSRGGTGSGSQHDRGGGGPSGRHDQPSLRTDGR
ncbi:unnamed protein product, partial [Ectocarpus sp. 8 AP-2014]